MDYTKALHLATTLKLVLDTPYEDIIGVTLSAREHICEVHVSGGIEGLLELGVTPKVTKRPEANSEFYTHEVGVVLEGIHFFVLAGIAEIKKHGLQES